MTIYFLSILIISIFVISYLSILVKNKFFTFFSVILILLMISLFYGLRDIITFNPDGFLTDSYKYMLWFQEIESLKDIFWGSSSWKKNYLFFFIDYLVHQFTDNYHIYFLINSLISFTILFFAYYKIIEKEFHFYLPLVLLFIVSSSTVVANYGNLLRQGLGISVFVLSLSYMINNRYWIGYVLIILSFFIHQSVLVFIFIYFIVFNLKISIRYLVIILFASLIFLKLNILNIVPFLLHVEKIHIYAESTSPMIFYKLIFLYSLSILLLIFLKYNNTDKKFQDIFKVYILLLSISMAFSHIEIVSARLLYFASILVPYFILTVLLKTRQKLFLLFLFSIGSVVYAYLVFEYSATYKTILFNNALKWIL